MFTIAKANQNNQHLNHKEDKHMLKNQLFGVEVEMTGITREKAAKIDVIEVKNGVNLHKT